MRSLYLLLAVVVCFNTTLRAQESSSATVPGTVLSGDTVIYIPVIVRRGVVEDGAGRRFRLSPVREIEGPRHSVSLEIGAYAFCGSQPPFAWIVDVDQSFWPGDALYYDGPLVTTGVIGAAYGYRAKRWLEVGATLSYAGFFRDWMRTSNHAVAERQREHYISVMPFVRFSWLNRPSVRLYSGFQLGFQLGFEKYREPNYRCESYFAGQLTMIGISVGRRVFGYAEFGIGTRGVVLCGFGYRFGEVKK